MINTRFLFGLVGSAIITTGIGSTAAHAIPLVQPGSSWKYLDNGTNQGTAWQATAFDDSTWAFGPAQLGYGDGDEATVVSYGPNPSNKYITTYFRHSFNITDPAAITSLTFSLLRDDGAVVYLNGTEVLRSNMPVGTINYLTLASSTIGGSGESIFYDTVTDSSLIVAGTNVIAVEVHQRSATSSDMSFDLGLTDDGVGYNILFVAKGADWKYLDNGTNQGVAWRAPTYNDTFWASGPAQLGYGDGDESTVVSYGPNASNKYVTTYFRHTFNVVDPSVASNLTFSLLRDDGAVVYLNGTEVVRSNMTAGVYDYLTYASSTVSGANESTYFEYTLSAAPLVAGNNVIAVEIHQRSATSSDISFDLQLTDAVTSLTRAPYLQQGASDSAVIRWRTNVATVGVVQYGSAPGSLTSSAVNTTPATDHEITLTGLTPDTVYFYSVGTKTQSFAGDDADHFFRTSPAVGTTGPTRIWVVGDSGTGNSNAAAVRDAYLSYSAGNPADLWLMLGDNAYNSGTDSEYQTAVFNMYPTILQNTMLWSTLGNHDGYSADSATETGPYYEIFTFPRNGEAGGIASGTEAYYSFDYANIHFVCLESYETNRAVGGPMLTWLAADLASTLQPWIIAYWHHPPYTKGSHDSDAEIRLIEMRQNALPMLEAAGVDLVLSGHSHSYERSFLLDGHYGFSWTLNPATMILDGGSGQLDGSGAYIKPTSGLAPNEGTVFAVPGSSGKLSAAALNHPAMHISLLELGSMVLDVTDNQLDAVFINNVGAISDHFTIIKGTPCAGDVNGDAVVNVADLLDLISAWGPCPGCPQDLNGDGAVNVPDLLQMIAAWGPCV